LLADITEIYLDLGKDATASVNVSKGKFFILVNDAISKFATGVNYVNETGVEP
jgi:hypothetical protein